MSELSLVAAIGASIVLAVIAAWSAAACCVIVYMAAVWTGWRRAVGPLVIFGAGAALFGVGAYETFPFHIQVHPWWHTRGPLSVCHDGKCPCGFIWGGDGHVHVASVYDSGDLGLPHYGADCAVKPEVRELNSRLLAASYNSYDKHFGERAVEAAEGDLLGEALASLGECLCIIEGTFPSAGPSIKGIRDRARALLSKLSPPVSDTPAKGE